MGSGLLRASGMETQRRWRPRIRRGAHGGWKKNLSRRHPPTENWLPSTMPLCLNRFGRDLGSLDRNRDSRMRLLYGTRCCCRCDSHMRYRHSQGNQNRQDIRFNVSPLRSYGNMQALPHHRREPPLKTTSGCRRRFQSQPTAPQCPHCHHRHRGRRQPSSALLPEEQQEQQAGRPQEIA